jgi:hypothetical protein
LRNCSALYDQGQQRTENTIQDFQATPFLTCSGNAGAVRRTVFPLSAAGQGSRQKDEADGRATVIGPSLEVREFLANRMPELAISPLTEALRGASDSEKATVLRGLRKLRALIEVSRFKT